MSIPPDDSIPPANTRAKEPSSNPGQPETLYEFLPALESLIKAEGYTYTTATQRRLIAPALQAIIRTQIKDGEEMRRRLADLENRFYDRD